MFNPSRDQVRQFFVDAWRKHRDNTVLTPLELMAANIARLHPEYHKALEDPASLERDYRPEDGQVNPFLHLSMHLAIEEQLSIDQPPGIRAAVETAAHARGDRHAALHDALECLGETIWAAQRNKTPPDGAAYLRCVLQRVGKGSA